MKQAGYYNGIVGKWHANKPQASTAAAFDYGRYYFGKHWGERNGVPRHVTDVNKEDSLDFLRTRPKDQPFFLTTAFYATHALDYKTPSYEPQNTSMDWYTDGTYKLPFTLSQEHWNRLPWFFVSNNDARIRNRNRFINAEHYDKNIRDLYRLATEVDVVVGNIVQELKNQGVYDNTLVIFTTDNGNMHGEHGLADKWYPWQESIQVPLVIQDPRMKQRGERTDALTLSIDLTPTILRAAGIDPPSFMQGRDLS